MLTQEQKRQLYLWWHLFKNDGDLVELRVVGDKVTYSGYYKDINNIIRDVDAHIDQNIYFTINPINDALHGRPQCEQMLKNPKNTTSDAEVVGRVFVFLDIDCKKVANVNSTDEEKEIAHQKTLKIYRYLKAEGFNEPIVVDSANSYHLYIPCKLKNSEENTNLIKRFTLAMGMLFSDDQVEVDSKVFNLGRIAKLPSTFSRKGSALSVDRPQRMCKILKYPSEIEPTPREYFEKIANLYPEDEVKPNKENHYSTERFDLESFLNKHGINYKTESVADGTKYVLDHCVFNEQHKGKDAVIFQRSNGALAYHCMHNSCSHYKWQDVRKMFEPDAYEKKDYREFQYKQRYYEKYSIPQEVEIKEESEELGKKWLTLRDIKMVKDSERFSIKTGIYALDKSIGGLFESETTLLSGINASGKTAILNQIILNAAQRNIPSGLWSGELPANRIKSWICQTAAGKQNVTKIEGRDNAYEVNDDVIEKIESWIDERVVIYNNNYGSNSKQILADLEEAIKKYGLKLVLLDNLMALSLDNLVGTMNEKQKDLMLELDKLAKKYKIHILIIAHPRKEANFQLLRKESISGTSDLTNIVWNVLLIHRVGDDFEKRATEFWGKERTNKLILEDYSNIIEVAKNRDYGVVDFVIGLYYEPETKRFKNSKAEQMHYDWEERYEEYTVPQEETPMTFIAPNPNFDMPQESTQDDDVYWGQFQNDTDTPF